jgi:dipeptidyl aminopeptidase/acylaminoacyl peptidase
VQFLVRERKVAVMVPNVRGSSGYGKTYLALDNGKLREDSVKDIGSLIGWIQTKPEFDANRIAVYGGSYGGYMVLASMVHFGEQIRAGIDIVGISNFVTFLKNTNPYRVDQRRPEYGDERDPEMARFLEGISPLNRAGEIRAPLFVIQGANDPRVPASEAEQILRAVRDNRQTAWYLLALDEGHGFKKKANKDRMGEAVIQFLDRHLLAP